MKRNDERTKASSLVGKSMIKTKGSLRSQRSIIHSLNRTVLVNKRSIKDRGNIGVVKGASNDRKDINKFIPKKTTHPRVEHSGSSLVVGRQLCASRTSGNLNARPNKGEVGFRTLGHEGLLA